MRRRDRKLFWAGMAHLWVFAAGASCGVVLAVTPIASAADIDRAYDKLRVFSQVLAYVQDNYVDDIAEEELIYNAVSGMLQDLDPHTTFMRPGAYQKLREDTAGEFGGLGIDLLESEQGVVIEAVHADGAAARAGLQTGDRIVRIDGDAAQRLLLADVVERLRGLPGTQVVLGIQRASWPAPRDIPLVRRHVRVASVRSTLLPGGIGFVHIDSFQERTDHELGLALNQLRGEAKRSGHPELRGLILDLRDNPGGLLDEGVKVADRFLTSGLIVRTEGRNPRNVDEERAHPQGTEPDYPMAVLVNAGSASASEIVAGALQDHHRAAVIGTRSYGKGSVQTLFGLEDGSGLKLTIARYFTPSGRSIQDRGILPDRVQEPAESAAPARFPEGLGADPQVRAALESLGQTRDLARPRKVGRAP